MIIVPTKSPKSMPTMILTVRLIFNSIVGEYASASNISGLSVRNILDAAKCSLTKKYAVPRILKISAGCLERQSDRISEALEAPRILAKKLNIVLSVNLICCAYKARHTENRVEASKLLITGDLMTFLVNQKRLLRRLKKTLFVCRM